MPLPVSQSANHACFGDTPNTQGSLEVGSFANLTPKAQLKQLRAELEVWVQQGSASEYRRLASDRIYQSLHQHLHPRQQHLGQYPASTHLSLSGLQLKTLPECLGHLTQLRSLNLSTNIGLKLPDCMLKLGQLEELNLSGSLCGNVPACVSHLASLNKLNLSACMLEQLPVELSNLGHLEWLDLSGNRLDGLPSALGQLSALTHFNLGHNRFQILPTCITTLTQLENLDLAFNQLSNLPNSIENLTNLRKLNLNRNCLSALPPQIEKLRELTTLMANYNRITKLPEELGQLAALKSLSLQTNPLNSLPDSIGQLRNLQQLDLMSTHLQTLPPGIGNLSCLDCCNLCHAPIQNLPPSVVLLPSTCHVQFRNDYMTVFQRLVWRNECTRIRQDTAYPRQGPYLHFELPILQSQLPQPCLEGIIQQCFTEAGQPLSNQELTDWANHLGSLPAHERSNLEELFQQLLNTRAFVLTRQHLLPQLVWLLKAMLANPQLLQTCACIATESLKECEDRTTLGFIQMGDAALHAHANSLHPTPEKLLQIGKRLFNSSTLQTLAQEHVRKLPGDTDATEIILKYWVELSCELNLPWQIQVMGFDFLADAVDDAAVHTAKCKVREAAEGPEFAQFLCRWPAWHRALQQQNPERFAELDGQCKTLKCDLHNQLQSALQQTQAPRIALLQSVEALRHQYLDVECRVWMEWTLSLLNVSRLTHAQTVRQMDDIQSDA